MRAERGDGTSVALGIGALILLVGSLVTGVLALQRPEPEFLTEPGDPGIDWGKPLSDATPVRDAEEAASYLDFSPISPREDLGPPAAVFMSRPESHGRPLRGLAFAYEHPTYGPFVILEGLSELTLPEVLGLASQCIPPSCEGRIVALSDGSQAFLASGSTGVRTVLWVRGRVRIDVMGPVSTFAEEYALAVANSL